jgi:hypothetical protein
MNAPSPSETDSKKITIFKRLSEVALVVDTGLIFYNLLTGDPIKAWSHAQYALWWIIVRWHWL